jgi:hypothetical protein
VREFVVPVAGWFLVEALEEFGGAGMAVGAPQKNGSVTWHLSFPTAFSSAVGRVG